MLLDIRQEVILDKNNVPKVMKVNRLQTLDCGHSYKPGDQYIECDNGHVLCFRHELFTCSKCGKRICELDLDFKDGKPICKEHNEWSIFKTIMVCVFIILGIAFLIWLKNECGC